MFNEIRKSFNDLTLDIPTEFSEDFIRTLAFKRWWTNLTDNINNLYAYCHGVSKFVMFLKKSDWVVKIPLQGSFDDSGYFYLFNNATNEKGEQWNYCEMELDIYNNTKSQELECFFAKTYKLCESADNYPIYIQEKVIVANEDTEKRTPSKDSLNIIRKKEFLGNGKRRKFFNNHWLALAIDFYGEEKVEQFLMYLKENESVSSDLHEGNYGYRMDGSPCLLDFSGWDD